MNESLRPQGDPEATAAKDSLRCRRVEDALYRRACGYKVKLKKSFKVKRVEYDSDTGKKISEREDLEAGWSQYLYLPDTDVWFAEDEIHPTGMVRRDGYLCLQDSDGYVWLTSSDGRSTGCSFDERHVRGEVEASVTLAPDYGLQPDGARLTGLYIRATGGGGSEMEVRASYADGQAGKDAVRSGEISLGVYKGKMTDRLLRIPVTAKLCDGVRLRLVMTGTWIIHAVIREYERGGQ